MARLNQQDEVALIPQSPTRFMVTGIDASVELVLDGDRVTGATIGQGGQTIALTRSD